MQEKQNKAQSNPFDDIDFVCSSDTKMDPKEVMALEMAFQEGGMESAERFIRNTEEDGTIKEIKYIPKINTSIPVISQSLIKDLIYKGNELEYCPHKFYRTWIAKDIQRIPSESMMEGSFGETLLLGGSARGQFTFDLPRDKRTGNKKINQQRIEIQVERAKITKLKHNLTIIPDINTQIVLKKVINGVLCQGELDIFPATLNNIDINNLEKHILSFIDVKFTGDIDSTFGYNNQPGWGDYANMDHIQMKMYHELVRDIDFELNNHLTMDQINLLDSFKNSINDIMGLYWVFSYKVPEERLSDKFLGYTYDATKKAELYEDIRKVVSIIEFHNNNNDWDRCVTGTCKNCNVLDCIMKNQIQQI